MSNYSRYKSRHTHSIDTDLLILIIGIVLAFLLSLASNACTAKEWNGGVCPDCNVRYELRGVYKGTHYYACPSCGNEVDRYGASNVKIMCGNTAFLLQDYNPLKGELYYAVDTQRYYMWNGSTWVCIRTMDESGNQTSHPTNCVNCGAVLHSCRCEYCGTEYFD